MITKDDFLIMVCQLEVFLQPLQLRGCQFTRLPIKRATIEVHIIEAHIMDITTVKAIIGRTKALFPFSEVKVTTILIVVANDGEYCCPRRA